MKSYYVCVFITTFEKSTKILDLLFNLSLKVQKIQRLHEAAWMVCMLLHVTQSTSTTRNAKPCLLDLQSVQL